MEYRLTFIIGQIGSYYGAIATCTCSGYRDDCIMKHLSKRSIRYCRRKFTVHESQACMAMYRVSGRANAT